MKVPLHLSTAILKLLQEDIAYTKFFTIYLSHRNSIQDSGTRPGPT